jgi:protein-disulfide isomerase
MIPTRLVHLIAALGCLAAVACGTGLRHVAAAQVGAAPGAQPSNPQANEPSTPDDPLSRDRVWNDPDIPALGNPAGDLTIVEYFDYQCPVCKQVHPDLMRVIAEDGKVRLVSRNWPIFGAVSAHAARMALAAKYQGKYVQAHEALFTAKRRLSETVARQLLDAAGVDTMRAARDLAANRAAIDAVLARNQAQAVAFGFLGTPAFVVGKFRVNVGLSAENFKRVIADARAAEKQP